MKTRRSPQTIYFDIINAINQVPDEDRHKGSVIASASNLSYDKFKTHCFKMIKFELITSDYTITEKGLNFTNAYNNLQTKATDLSKIYFDDYTTIIPELKNIDDLLDIILTIKEQLIQIDNWAKSQRKINNTPKKDKLCSNPNCNLPLSKHTHTMRNICHVEINKDD